MTNRTQVHRHRRGATVLGVAAVATVALTVAACGSSGPTSQPTSGSPSVSTPADAPTSATPGSPPPVVKLPAQVPNDVAKRSSVAVTGCQAGNGGWTASGTASAPAGKAASYKITVFFTSTKATVLGWGSTSVHVPAGGTQHWSVTKRLPDGSGDALCVLRGVG